MPSYVTERPLWFVQTQFPWGTAGTCARTVVCSAWPLAMRTEHLMLKTWLKKQEALSDAQGRAVVARSGQGTEAAAGSCPNASDYYCNSPLPRAELAEGRADPATTAQPAVTRSRCVASAPPPTQDPVPSPQHLYKTVLVFRNHSEKDSVSSGDPFSSRARFSTGSLA